ncbi:MAG TPA: F0F1 ATP synthase subunit delta [Patescibacteria group bacterium]|nr:F0F1 ATP synthase subunit delta [Patescibacteria group bacterium]
MAGKTGNQAIARRYATAFFELASEQSQLDQIANDLRDISAMLRTGGDIDRFVSNTTLRRDEQVKALQALAQHMNLSPLSAKMLGTVAQNRRLPDLAAIVAATQELIAEKRGEVTAEVTAAQALDQAQIDEIAANLKQVLGKNVIVNLSVDADIMGGLIVKVGSKLIDSSVRTKLERLHRALKSNNESSDKAQMKEVA